jgi:type IV pilus assembly protein PilQ
MNMDKLVANMTKLLIAVCVSFSVFFAMPMAVAAEPAGFNNRIENVEFVNLSGGRVSVNIKTSNPLKNPPASFTLTNPSRITLDFPNTSNGLSKNSLNADFGALKSVSLAQAKDRTRIVLNLSKAVAYTANVNGNQTEIILQGNAIDAGAVGTETHFAEAKLGGNAHTLKNVDFMRGKNGEGRVMVDLSDTTTGINIRQQGKKVIVDFINTQIPANLERRLNVTNFNTPVVYVDAMKKGNNVQLVIEPQGNWEQSAYQADKRFIIDIKKIVEDPNKLVQGSKPGYAGEKLSLNFQNIDVRSVLQVIADFTSLNIITSDTVTGNLTLRLKDVPWDQALDIIMQSKGLAQRKTGNVIWIAPTDEMAAKEKQALEASQQIEDLEQLHTESFTLKYQKAEDLQKIITDSKQKILSKRGSAVIDPRTNTLFVQDIARNLEEVQRIINKTDVAVQQVMIESRLVLASEGYGKSLGARLGVQKQAAGGNSVGLSSTIGNVPSRAYTPPTRDPNTGNLTAFGKITDTYSGQIGSAALAGAPDSGSLTGGPPYAGLVGTSPNNQPDLNVNLPAVALGAAQAASMAFSWFRLPAGLMLNLELSAMETDARGKIVSSPRVTTTNQQKATISAGTEIPYQQSTSSGATSVAFKSAVLSLEVTPQITPDQKIIMDLEVKKESIALDVPRINGVPAIATQKVQTQALVGNGETAVLGGIFEQNENDDVKKVPMLGDVPILGNLFKTKTRQNNKQELLIFITPRIMDESLGVR